MKDLTNSAYSKKTKQSIQNISFLFNYWILLAMKNINWFLSSQIILRLGSFISGRQDKTWKVFNIELFLTSGAMRTALPCLGSHCLLGKGTTRPLALSAERQQPKSVSTSQGLSQPSARLIRMLSGLRSLLLCYNKK